MSDPHRMTDLAIELKNLIIFFDVLRAKLLKIGFRIVKASWVFLFFFLECLRHPSKCADDTLKICRLSYVFNVYFLFARIICIYPHSFCL